MLYIKNIQYEMDNSLAVDLVCQLYVICNMKKELSMDKNKEIAEKINKDIAKIIKNQDSKKLNKKEEVKRGKK